MQALKNDENDDEILIGEGKRKVIVNTKPLEWECPISIDVEAVDRIGDFQKEFAETRSPIPINEEL